MITRLSHILLVPIFLGIVLGSFGQSNQEEYLQSNPDKKQFDSNQWGKLKGKMKQESSNSSSSGAGEFYGDNFSTEQGQEGDAYNFEQEDYKGEYSDYQNLYDPANEDYDYDEDNDNYQHQENNYHNNKTYYNGEYNK